MKSRVKRVHSEIARAFLMICKELMRKDIVLTKKSHYSPQSSGLLWHMNCTLLGKLRSILNESGLHHRYCAETVEKAPYLFNKKTRTALQKRLPYEMLFGILPNISIVRKFGWAAYLLVSNARRNSRLSDHIEIGIYLGNTNEIFTVHSWQSNRVTETKHFSFDEGWYPRQKEMSFVTIEDPIREGICRDQIS